MGKYLFILLSFVSVRAAANCDPQPMSFMLLAQDGKEHILASLRTEKAPLNLQLIVRLRLDAEELKAYAKLTKSSKTLPAIITSPVCPADLLAEKNFPIKVKFLSNADHEGTFDAAKALLPKSAASLQRADIEILLNRSLDRESAYLKAEGGFFNPARECLRNELLKNTPVPETIHSFVILKEVGTKAVLAVHYIDYAPHNFQTIVKIKLNETEMKSYQTAKKDGQGFPLFQTRVKTKTGAFQDSYFCIENIRKQKAASQFRVSGTVYKNTDLVNYKLGDPVSTWDISSEDIEVLVNRRIETLLNPADLAAEAQKASAKK